VRSSVSLVIPSIGMVVANGCKVFVVLREHVAVVCFSNEALKSTWGVLQVSNVQGWGRKQACEQFSQEVDISGFALQSECWGQNALIRWTVSHFHCEQFEWRHISNCVSTFHSMFIMLLCLRVECNGFSRSYRDFHR